MKQTQLNIIFEDNDILVCVKPAGIATESANIRTPDMISMVKSYLLQSSFNRSGHSDSELKFSQQSIGIAVNKSEPYVGLIHRLDQPVSGILVFAKNPAAAANLSKQVQTDDMQKHYTAVVEGNFSQFATSVPNMDILPDDSVLLTNYLLKDSKQNKAIIAPKGQKGPDGKPAKEAKLIIEDISYREGADVSILKIKLLTGRFHQIRAQLSNIGYPIIGDSKYGACMILPDMDKKRLPNCFVENEGGIALCASELAFKHPLSGKYMNYTL